MCNLLLFILSLLPFFIGAQPTNNLTLIHGGFVRGDSTKKELALIFTADEWGEGLPHIRRTLKKEGVKGSFFFTGRFYRNRTFKKDIVQLAEDGHYLGPHSDQHLLYNDWNRRDSLLVTKDSFSTDLEKNKEVIKNLRLPLSTPHFFVPPYEWWNDSIAAWSREKGLTLVSFTPGIRTNADYTWPQMGAAYKSSAWIMQWLKESVNTTPQKWNGAVILVHAGTDPKREDKLYHRLQELIYFLRSHSFAFKRVDELLGQ